MVVLNGQERMSLKLNKVFISGRITKDPELGQTNSTNGQFTRFSLAVRSEFKDSNGEYKTTFIDCTAFGQTANYIATYCKKGFLLNLMGRLDVHPYQTKSGETAKNYSVVVEMCENCTPREAQPQQTQQVQQQQSTQYQPPQNPNIVVDDDDLPF